MITRSSSTNRAADKVDHEQESVSKKQDRAEEEVAAMAAPSTDPAPSACPARNEQNGMKESPASGSPATALDACPQADDHAAHEKDQDAAESDGGEPVTGSKQEAPAAGAPEHEIAHRNNGDDNDHGNDKCNAVDTANDGAIPTDLPQANPIANSAGASVVDASNGNNSNARPACATDAIVDDTSNSKDGADQKEHADDGTDHERLNNESKKEKETKKEQRKGSTENSNDQNKDEDEAKGKDKDTGEDEDEDEGDGGWDLHRIFSIAELSSTAEIRLCDQCSTQAFGIYVKSDTKSDKWAYCVDCQENDFGGWPSPSDIPVSFLAVDHKKLIKKKCSKRRNPKMPDLPQAPPAQTARHSKTADETPCPPLPNVCSPSTSSGGSPAQRQPLSCIPQSPPTSNAVQALSMSKCVTPPPSNVVAAMITDVGSRSKSPKAITPRPSTSRKPSKASLAIHKKWQDAATAMGGGRIIVSKAAAEKLILDMLYRAMKPVNITQAHKKLKGVVPAPLLSSCLKEMASKDDGEDSNANPFDVNSDDDDGKENRDGRRSQGQPRQDTHKKAPSSDALCGSVVYKPGRSLNASLYYFDHGKKPGLSPSEQGELASKLAVSTAKRDALEDELNATLFSTRKLANEPTNLDLETRLDEHESTVSQYRIEVEDARKLQVNQEHKARTKRKITKMTTVWRSRKRICLDFMNHLEEVTDGMVSARKCFKGDGQISLDSDEVVRDGAIRFEKDKRDRKRMLGDRMKTNALRASHAKLMAGSSLKGPRSAQHSKRATGAMASDLANPDFVAVMLNSQGHVQRVHLDADEIRSKSSSG